MATLVILLPPRERLSARPFAGDIAPAVAGLPAEFEHVLSHDGVKPTDTGRAAPAALPRADQVVLVLADADVAWHRINVPKAPAQRLRAALAGVLEEALLEDEEGLHLALGPGAVLGQPGWVAVTQRARLAAALAALEQAGLTVDRVVPSSVPLPEGQPGARGHFFEDGGDGGDSAAPWLSLARADGATCLRTSGALARALLPPSDAPSTWTATPAAAAAAERWLGAPVSVMGEAERALQAAQLPLNLRQFDMAPQVRGLRALRGAARGLLSVPWRPVRWGLAALVTVQLVGLNAWAWQQRQAMAERQQAMAELLRSTHPGVRAVLDAPLQMQRETARLRAAAGRPGDGDFEALLGAAAAAWPDGQGPVQTLRFESGRLSLAAAGWGEPQLAQFRERLLAAGYAAELSEGRVTVTPRGERGSA